MAESEYVRKRHVRYFGTCLKMFPNAATALDQNRMTLTFFCLSGLDLNGALDEVKDKQGIIDWIYSQQVAPDEAESNAHCIGFRGAPCNGNRANPEGTPCAALPHDVSHIAMTYTALCCLGILGDDFGRVNRAGILRALESHQLPGGSVQATCFEGHEGEADVRFVFCLCAVCYMLGDWGRIDRDGMAGFLLSSLAFDSGFGQTPENEGHGGSTFCALSALSLMGKLDEVIPAERRQGIVRWLVMRQEGGFQGRPNKVPDTCYSFWVGASLALLGAGGLMDEDANEAFLLSTQHVLMGGFAKVPDCSPDPYHAYMGTAAMALMARQGVKPLHPGLNISQEAHDRIAALW